MTIHKIASGFLISGMLVIREKIFEGLAKLEIVRFHTPSILLYPHKSLY